MEVNNIILNYLTKNTRPINSYELGQILKLDIFLVEKALDDLELDFKIKRNKKGITLSFYKEGVIKLTRNGNGQVVVGDDTLFIKSSNLNGANNGDKVLIDLFSKNNLEGKVVNIIKKNRLEELGTVIMENGQLYVKADNNNMLVKVKDNIFVGEKVLFSKNKLVKNNIYSGSIVKVIGHIDDPKINIKSKLFLNNIETEFSTKTLEELESIPTSVEENDMIDRVDLRSKTIFTIDGDESKDLDDAISFEILPNGNYLLGVHIAHVSHYVKEGSSIDLDAYKRGTSTYPPGAVNPMLHHKISSGICSLFQDVDRLTRTCEMEFTKDGTIVDYRLYNSVICSSKRMTYSKVNDVLNGNCSDEYKSYEKVLKNCNEFAKVLRKKRLNNGSIDFDKNEVKINVDEMGNPTDIYEYKRYDAEKLIEEFMLQANIYTPLFLEKYNIPINYRVHGEPKEDKMKSFLEVIKTVTGLNFKMPINVSSKQIGEIIKQLNKIPNSDTYIDLLLRVMKKAKYSPDNIGHFGLNFSVYSQSTSPIRRYPDLILQRIGDMCLSNTYSTKKYDISVLREKCIRCSLTEVNSDKCERDVKRMLMAQFLEDKMGNIYSGKIVSFFKDSVCIKLNNGIEGYICHNNLNNCKINMNNYTLSTPYKLYHLGDSIDVEVIYANKDTSTINFKQKVLTK